MVLCTFDSSILETTSSGSKIELSTQKLQGRNQWYYYSSTYNEALTFTAQMIKKDGAEFTRQELATLSRWLLRKDGFKKFEFIGGNLTGITFFVTVTELNELSVSESVYGVEAKFTCNAPFGYGKEIIQEKEFIGNDDYVIMNRSDENGYLYPDITIHILQDGDITIRNQENRETIIKKCIVGEVISIDGNSRLISSTKPDISSRFNYKWFRLIRFENEVENKITSTAPCKIKIQYRPIRKVGVS